MTGLAFDYIFANACRHDLNSELASFHSNEDYDAYFELVGNWSGNPFGLNFMTCQIGLWNESLSQPQWQWMDGTPYNWGQYGTNSSYWFDDYWVQNEGCVSVRNSLYNPSNRIWEQYVCNTAFQVHCGVCSTPRTRDYKLELSGTVYQPPSPDLNTGHMLVLLVGEDIFKNGNNTINLGWVNINTAGDFQRNISLKNATNIGPIRWMYIVTNLNIIVGM